MSLYDAHAQIATMREAKAAARWMKLNPASGIAVIGNSAPNLAGFMAVGSDNGHLSTPFFFFVGDLARLGGILGCFVFVRWKIFLYNNRNRAPDRPVSASCPFAPCRKTAPKGKKAGLRADLVAEWPYNSQKKPDLARYQPNLVHFWAAPARQSGYCSPTRAF